MKEAEKDTEWWDKEVTSFQDHDVIINQQAQDDRIRQSNKYYKQVQCAVDILDKICVVYSAGFTTHWEGLPSLPSLVMTDIVAPLMIVVVCS